MRSIQKLSNGTSRHRLREMRPNGIYILRQRSGHRLGEEVSTHTLRQISNPQPTVLLGSSTAFQLRVLYYASRSKSIIRDKKFITGYAEVFEGR